MEWGVEPRSKALAKHECDEAILDRLVVPNAERTAEEARGLVRWLRPEFQNPQAHKAPEQSTFPADSSVEVQDAASIAASAKPIAWPKDAVDQVRAVANLLASSALPLFAALRFGAQ